MNRARADSRWWKFSSRWSCSRPWLRSLTEVCVPSRARAANSRKRKTRSAISCAPSICSTAISAKPWCVRCAARPASNSPRSSARPTTSNSRAWATPTRRPSNVRTSNACCIEFDDQTFKRGRFAVLDRANDTQPQILDSHVAIDALRFRFLSPAGQWLDVWPPPAQKDDPAFQLPRAVQWNLRTQELRRAREHRRTRFAMADWRRHARGGDAMTRQRGVALIIALLVVALAAILIAGLLDRGGLAAARTRNALREMQAEHYAKGLEDYAARVLTQDSQNTATTIRPPTSGPCRCHPHRSPAATSPRR